MQSFIGLAVLLATTIINIIGVRLLSIINNIGVAAEIIGMVFFALILLFFANHQSPSVLFDTSYTAGLADGNYSPCSWSACSWRSSWSTASTRRGRSARRRSTPADRRRAASSRRSGCRASSARSSCSRSPCRSRTSRRRSPKGQAFGFPIATTIKENLTYTLGGVTVGELYLVVILIAVYVCTLAIQGATSA